MDMLKKELMQELRMTRSAEKHPQALGDTACQELLKKEMREMR